tara:strand:+ start:67 stop:384 length:318 start_codon:yes stop_codon:yes gene_type:complete
MSNWKNFERRVAKKVGGKRIPITGRKGLDIDHPTLDIECKYRRKIPEWLFTKAWGQANEGTGTPLIVVGEFDNPRIWCILSLDDFISIFNQGEEVDEKHDDKPVV